MQFDMVDEVAVHKEDQLLFHLLPHPVDATNRLIVEPREVLQGNRTSHRPAVDFVDVEVVEEAPTTELNIRVDTLRRLRRQRIITREGEISELINLGLDSGLAQAYADNDDLRLAKETTGEG